MENYQELTLCIRNNYMTGKLNEPCDANSAEASSKDFLLQLQQSAKVLLEEMQQIKGGKYFLEYKQGVSDGIISRLNKVNVMILDACKIGKEVASLLKKFGSLKRDVVRKETKYMKLRKPICESKRYMDQVKKMEKAELKFEQHRKKFDECYNEIMQNQLFASGRIMDDFFGLNLKYYANLLQVISCIAPDGISTLEGMVSAYFALSQRMGVELGHLEESVMSGPNNLRVPLHRVSNSKGALEMDFTQPSRTSVRNFTSYCYACINGELRDPSTPRTVRVSEPNIAPVTVDVSNEPMPRQPDDISFFLIEKERRQPPNFSLDPMCSVSEGVSPPLAGDVNRAFISSSPQVRCPKTNSMPASEILRQAQPSFHDAHQRLFNVSDPAEDHARDVRYSLASAADATRSRQPYSENALKPPLVSAPPDDNTISNLSVSTRPVMEGLLDNRGESGGCEHVLSQPPYPTVPLCISPPHLPT
ncbi:unnamed protein product [Phytomonas sp. EM1]|nr:unnamed protein product [Phytomonas sp. EM1]|eukprot:CCW65339.1 unnamed protein product [Phytomonas sp. isolate EM1]